MVKVNNVSSQHSSTCQQRPTFCPLWRKTCWDYLEKISSAVFFLGGGGITGIAAFFFFFLLCHFMLTSPYTVLHYTFTCGFQGLISEITGSASTPGLKMPVTYVPWLYLFKSVSTLLFHTPLLHLFMLLKCAALNQDYTMYSAEFPFISGFWRSNSKFSQIQLLCTRCPAAKCALALLVDKSYHRKASGASCRP